MKKHTNSLNLVKEIKDQTKVYARTKKILKLVSDDLSSYANSLDKDTEILSDSRNAAFDALGKSLVLYAESFPDETEQLEILEAQLNEFLKAREGANLSTIGFRNSISALPRFTAQFNKSKREATQSLEKFIIELDDVENTIFNLLDSIRKLKGRGKTED